MGQATQNKNYFSFAKGLITEASELNYPENSATVLENFELHRDGSIEARKGIDYSSASTLASTSSSAISVGEWLSAGGDPDQDFAAVQVGSTLYFYDQSDDDLTNNLETNSINLISRKLSSASNADVIGAPLSYASGKGYLIIVGKYILPTYISFTAGSPNTFTANAMAISARDFIGTLEEVGNGDRPLDLTAAHAYDLRNQGWSHYPVSKIDDFKTNSSNTSYPSNSDIWWYGKYVVPATGLNAFDAAQIEEQEFGNSSAPKGHFRFPTILIRSHVTGDRFTCRLTTYSVSGITITVTTDVDHKLDAGGISSVTIIGDSHTYTDSGGPGNPGSLDGVDMPVTSIPTSTTFTISNLDLTIPLVDYVSTPVWGTKGYIRGLLPHPNSVTETAAPTCTAFFAGRHWYAGIESATLSTNIYYSQLSTDITRLGDCYQEADPTAEDINELLATDGGHIPIPDMGRTLKLVATARYLLVFASNGVWLITGSEGTAFTATDQAVHKIMDAEIYSPDAIVLVDGTAVFMTGSTIYALEESSETRTIAPRNISDETILTEMLTIPTVSYPYVKGIYNPLSKEISWLYHSTTAGYAYDRQITLNLGINAFYKYTFTASDPYIAAYVPVLNTNNPEKRVGYFTLATSNTEAAISNLTNTNYVDWYTFDNTGVAYTADIETAYELNQDGQRHKQAPTITTHFKRTETSFTTDGNGDIQLSPESSCTMQARWDWTSTTEPGKWGTAQQAYRFTRMYTPSGSSGAWDNGYPVVTTKNKVRGRGRALQLKFSSPSGYACHLLGYSVNFTGNTKV